MDRSRLRSTPVFESLIEDLGGQLNVTNHAFTRKLGGSAIFEDLWSFADPPSIVAAPQDLAARYDAVLSGVAQSNSSHGWSIDPEAISKEIGLEPGLTAERLAALRRAFAVGNHPDRFPPDLQMIATQRMMIANSLCDIYRLHL